MSDQRRVGSSLLFKDLEDPILQIARKEASLAHAAEFEPIVKGPFFAVLILIPLAAAAAFYVTWEKLSAPFARRP